MANSRKGPGEMSAQTGPHPATAGPAAASDLTKHDLAHITEDTIRKHNFTIDWELQRFISEISERYHIYYGAVAVMDSRRGDILALYGNSLSGEDCRLALDTEIAASVFKLVTATAAMEQCGFNGSSRFFYAGNAHTLYTNQLTKKRDRWSTDVTLTEAFARSNNVVFAKLGTEYLGKAPIALTARRLGFGRSPLRVLDAPASVLFSPQNEYNLAELASGFNHATRISPLHAAEMVTAALNGGYLVSPRLIKTERCEKTPAMRMDTAEHLRDMMERTVKSGTVAKHFRGTASDRVLKGLTIGGKSGSLDGTDPDGRRNWFVGFASDQQSGEAITIGCVLVLRERFRIQADMLSRLIIKEYFSRKAIAAQTAMPAAKARVSPKRL